VPTELLRAYIDESGDEGFVFPATPGGGGSSRWFVIAAVVVRLEDDASASKIVDRVKARLWPGGVHPWAKPLHWAKLNHKQRRVIVDEMIGEPISLLAVAFDKRNPKLDRTRFDSRLVRKHSPQLRNTLYFYATRFLTERICKMAKREDRRADLIFETRATLSVKEMATYLASLTSTPGPHGSPTIPTGTLGAVDAQGKQTKKLLQVADAFAGSVGAALEVDKYGLTDATYLTDLGPQLQRGVSVVWGYGLKLFPGQWQEYSESESCYSWMKKL
jgi:hypothetical protein